MAFRTTIPVRLGDIISDVKSGVIDLTPSYQRKSTWSNPLKRKLVRTILEDFDIPKVYLREVGDTYECVDGQQRFRAVVEFWDDILAFARNEAPIRGIDVAGKKFSNLPKIMIKTFNRYTLDVVYLTDWEDSAVEELYQRLQAGKQLNAAEIRHAQSREINFTVQALADHPMFQRLALFSNQRYGYEDAVALLLRLVLEGKITDIRAGNVTDTYNEFTSLTKDSIAARKVQDVLNFLDESLDVFDPLLGKASFVSLAFTAFMLMRTHNVTAFPKEFGEAFVLFENSRDDATFEEYNQALRNDSKSAQWVRYRALREQMIRNLSTMVAR